MAFALQNKYGLYLQTMGASRVDHSFTKDESQALVFDNEQDAINRKNKLAAFSLKVVPFIKTKIAAQQPCFFIFMLFTNLLKLFSS